MKNLFLGLLLCAASAHGQTYITVATEYQTIDIPAGETLTAVYGCTAALSSPFTLAGPLTNVGVQPSSFTGATDSGCTARALQVLQTAAPQSLTVHTLSYNSAGVLTNKSAPFTVAALPVVVGPAPPAVTVCSVSPTLTVAKDGTTTIVIPAPCLLKQTAWANTLTGDGYSIYILGNPSQALFAGQ